MNHEAVDVPVRPASPARAVAAVPEVGNTVVNSRGRKAMLTRLLCASLAACLMPSFSMWAQEATKDRPAFEVASVKRSPPAEDLDLPTAGTAQPNGRWFARKASLRLLLLSSHGLRSGELVGGPSWIDTEQFSIEARAPAGTSAERMRVMAQTLLADRFRLRTHTEQRRTPAYALVVARKDGRLGRGLRPTASDCSAGRLKGAKSVDGLFLCGGVSLRVVDGVRQVRLRGYSLPEFLKIALASPILGIAAVDRTGLTGYFDIDIDYVMPPSPGAVDSRPVDGPPLVEAVESQLGLRFERRDETVQVMVIDHAEMPDPD
jgi:uncharacterized protein (TIGR03435 family)